MADTNHEIYWPKIKNLAEAGSFNGIVEMVKELSDPKEQIALSRFAVRGLMFREWNSKTLVPIVQLGDLAIETAMQIGDTDQANVMCFNMSANLADCWNDGFTRQTDHLQKGLHYAEKALAFRKQLQKGPAAFALAYWALGIHQYSLGNFRAAEESFKESLTAACDQAQTENKPTTITKEAPFNVLIAYGYMALAQLAQGQKDAQKTYADVISAFEGMKTISDDAKADAEIGIDQLRNVHSRIK